MSALIRWCAGPVIAGAVVYAFERFADVGPHGLWLGVAVYAVAFVDGMATERNR